MDDAMEPAREVEAGAATTSASPYLAAVNIPLLLLAVWDRSWGAFAIGVLYSPIANAVIGLVSLASTPLVKRATGVAAGYHALVSVVMPTAAVLVDACFIFSMDLHGC